MAGATTPASTDAERTIARSTLRAYGLTARRLTHAGASFNTVFHAITDTGRHVAVRVGPADRIHPVGCEDAEAGWLDQLADEGAPVNRALRTPDGAAWVTVPDTAMVPRSCMVFEWATGTMMRQRLTAPRLERAGIVCAVLHELGAGTRPAAPPAGVPIGDRVVYFRVADRLGELREQYGSLFDDARDRAEEGLARVWRTHGASAHLVHGDLTPANLLVHRGEVTAIDFQDMLWAPEVQDLSMVVAVLRRDPEQADAFIGAFRRGYETRRPWPEVDDEDFEDLIAVRRLSITNLNLVLPWPNAPHNVARHADVVREYMARR